MSKLDELIKELCPNGVEYKNFGEIATIIRGASPRPIKNFITTNKEGVNWIKIGDVKPGEKYITETAEKITIEGAKKSREVKIGDFILSNSMSFGRPYILKVNGCIHDGWLSISGFENSFITDFLYHLLNSNVCQYEMKKKASFGGAVQNLNAEIVRSLVLPVPPLEVQREIVRILDSFTTLTEDLTVELTKELTARKKQYEYYRDMLISPINETPMISLGEIGRVRMCKRILKEQTSKIGDVPFYKIGTFGKKADAYISRELFEEYKKKYSYPEIGDVLISCSGTIGRTVVFNGEASYFQDSNIVWLEHDKTKVLNKYLMYCYSRQPWEVSTGGTISRLYNDNILKAKIPLHSLKVQKKIVDVLDNFEKICNDLNIGLPAEIEARKKQYEYYRDVLLTFAETGSTILTDRPTDRPTDRN